MPNLDVWLPTKPGNNRPLLTQAIVSQGQMELAEEVKPACPWVP